MSQSQFEYREIDLNDLPRKVVQIDLLNDAGGEGWELVAITSTGHAFLKRQVAPAAPSRRRKAPPVTPDPRLPSKDNDP